MKPFAFVVLSLHYNSEVYKINKNLLEECEKGPMDLIWTTATTKTNYPSRSLSLKAPSAVGGGEAASAAAAVGASGTA